ncbi:hypothetical protein H0A36_03910 [Endozoicomonas sp. SM1973]|uniref:Antitermination protein n=1 Tax=Spartinivicinus marinus TaxID=2994442 RepID=A0A853I5C2_9GAMM|nr:hypothetical protein [Spartinivicinus marinus]MCX4029566.1 hypothetical protein [Spartinivicinus marinus]NYZ65141.1 hypothetical protein [Spartinivicinus marinus]
MSAARMILLLNPKQCSLDHIPGGFNRISWEDVAAALAMGNLDSIAYYLGRTKYCHDEQAKAALIALIKEQAQRLASKSQWRATNERLERLSQLACLELVESPICRKCKGIGKILTISCQQCSGIGYLRQSERSKYLYAGIDKRCWARRWKDRYEQLYTDLCDAEHRLIRHLYHQLFDSEEEKQAS